MRPSNGWGAVARWLERRFPERWGGNGYRLRKLEKEVAALRRLLEKKHDHSN